MRCCSASSPSKLPRVSLSLFTPPQFRVCVLRNAFQALLNRRSAFDDTILVIARSLAVFDQRLKRICRIFHANLLLLPLRLSIFHRLSAQCAHIFVFKIRLAPLGVVERLSDYEGNEAFCVNLAQSFHQKAHSLAADCGICLCQCHKSTSKINCTGFTIFSSCTGVFRTFLSVVRK